MRVQRRGRMGVYLVDDETAVCDVLANRLPSQYGVETTTEPGQVDPAAVVAEFDCLVVGHGLRERTALALIRAVRDHDESFPAVVATRSGLETQALRATATTVVRRPTTEDRLARGVESALADAARVDATEVAELASASPDIGYVLGPNARLVAWDDRLVEVTGRNDDELADSDPLALFVPDDREAVRAAIGRCLGQESASVTATLRTPDGEGHPVVISGTRVTDATDRVVGVCGVARHTAAEPVAGETLDRQQERVESAVAEFDLAGPDGAASD